jgi:hypothetical protein
MKDLNKNQTKLLKTLAEGALGMGDVDMRTVNALVHRNLARVNKAMTKVTITAAGKKALN